MKVKRNLNITCFPNGLPIMDAIRFTGENLAAVAVFLDLPADHQFEESVNHIESGWKLPQCDPEFLTYGDVIVKLPEGKPFLCSSWMFNGSYVVVETDEHEVAWINRERIEIVSPERDIPAAKLRELIATWRDKYDKLFDGRDNDFIGELETLITEHQTSRY